MYWWLGDSKQKYEEALSISHTPWKLELTGVRLITRQTPVKYSSLVASPIFMMCHILKQSGWSHLIQWVTRISATANSPECFRQAAVERPRPCLFARIAASISCPERRGCDRQGDRQPLLTPCSTEIEPMLIQLNNVLNTTLSDWMPEQCTFHISWASRRSVMILKSYWVRYHALSQDTQCRKHKI